ncbi:MAG: chemotaxis protein CheW [Spirochaetae bacterium HGW-Spirochaetae-7]|jgi:purine-binding chemotaxis protein CheW|nr:MAG: chemotaxis protein CheW [Spirochaetae bacterium HGW-Spirochaetae-7]
MNPDLAVLFCLDEPRYAIPFSVVECVVRAAEYTPLPRAPEHVLGIVDFHGQIVPVMDLRSLFRLPTRIISCDDRFLMVRTTRRLLALLVDQVIGIHDLPAGTIADAAMALPLADGLQGVARLDDGLILICDVDRFLSQEEERTLDGAMAEGTR